ncbi:MAG: ATP synthase F1 subunit gamma [bacterium]|nr:ATP synthase F1 subunit gamma [bacterium]
MASTQQLKGRIRSVKNTKQITKAMELVAASKMRRAQDAAGMSRDYKNLAAQILTRLRELTDVDAHPLYRQRNVKTRLLVVVTSDRGLAGAYNSNILRKLTTELKEDKRGGVQSKLIVVGNQAANFAKKIKDIEAIGVYKNFPEKPTANDMRPILNTIIQKYRVGSLTEKEIAKEKAKIMKAQEIGFDVEELTLDGAVDAVDVLFTDFKSSIVQEVKVERLLPVAFSDTIISDDLELAIFEPSPKVVLDQVTERLIEVQLHQAFLESQASEHSMRMMAMKSATDNANDIIDDLTLEFNTARQAGITQELAEIVGGAEAIK